MLPVCGFLPYRNSQFLAPKSHSCKKSKINKAHLICFSSYFLTIKRNNTSENHRQNGSLKTEKFLVLLSDNKYGINPSHLCTKITTTTQKILGIFCKLWRHLRRIYTQSVHIRTEWMCVESNLLHCRTMIVIEVFRHFFEAVVTYIVHGNDW